MGRNSRRRILLATLPGDLHAFTIAEVLRAKGADPAVWFTPDFPTLATESVQVDQAGAIVPHLPAVGRWSFDAIWTRRVQHEMNPSTLEKADYSFAEVQCRRFRQAFLAEYLSDRYTDGGLCINPYRAAIEAENKLTQYLAARRVGLTVPQSLFSNSPREIKDFIDAQDGLVAFKPMRSILWVAGEKELLNLTRMITKEDLVADELLQLSPAIYQEVVPKSYELRVTMMGCRAFSARVNSQATERGREDWRRAYDELTMEPWTIPSDLESLCWELLQELGLYFGCFDFVVTPDNRFIFLEVNQGGQFLFVEEYTGLPLSDAFAEFLLQGRPNFDWKESSRTVSFKSVLDRAGEQATASFDEHVTSEPPKIVERTDLRSAERRKALL